MTGESKVAQILSELDKGNTIIMRNYLKWWKITPKIRASLLDSANYISRAVQVVTVVRDLDIAAFDVAKPQTARDVDELAALSERWGLSAPIARLQNALSR
jgi:hypothetical protein